MRLVFAMKAWIVRNFKDATSTWEKGESFWHSFVRKGKGQLSLMFFLVACECAACLAIFLIAYTVRGF